MNWPSAGGMVKPEFDAVLLVPSGAAGETLLSDNLAGMPAITRQLRLLALSGARRLVILHGKGLDRETLARTVNNRWCPDDTQVSVHQWTDERPGPWPALAADVLVLPGQNVLDHKCFLNPATYVSPDGESLVWYGCKTDARPSIARLLAGEQAQWPQTTAQPLPAGWLASQGATAEAQRALWESCRKPIDGIISTHFNRPVSLAISRRIVSLRVSPNQVTLFSAAIGLAGAACALAASYGMVLLGALLLQLASILDGVDGELARVRVQFSVLGEWLDTAADDMTNIAFVLAIGFARWLSNGIDGWTILALATAGAMILVAINYYVWIALAGRGDILSIDWFDNAEKPAQGLTARLVALGTTLFRRDMMIALILVAAIIGNIHFALVPIAIGEAAILAAQAARLVRRT